MKKFIFCAVLIFAVFTLASCSEISGADPHAHLSVVPDMDLDDRFFINHIFEIYMNHQLYLGQIIRYTGYFITERWQYEDVFSVVRVVPGCCSPTEMLGFEIMLNGHSRFPEFTWVELVGTLEFDEHGFLMIRAIYLQEAERESETA